MLVSEMVGLLIYYSMSLPFKNLYIFAFLFYIECFTIFLQSCEVFNFSNYIFHFQELCVEDCFFKFMGIIIFDMSLVK